MNHPSLIDMTTLEMVAPRIKAAAHPLRLRILDFLGASEGPRSVTEIIAAAEAEQASVSQQLRILKDQGLVSARREGNFIKYALADRSILFLLECIRAHGACPASPGN